MLLEPPQGRGFGIGVRLRTMSLRQSRMIQGHGLKFGWDALGHGDWEKSVAKQVGQTGDTTSCPKQTETPPTDFLAIDRETQLVN